MDNDIEIQENKVSEALRTVANFNKFVINYLNESYPAYSYFVESPLNDMCSMVVAVCNKNSNIKIFGMILRPSGNHFIKCMGLKEQIESSMNFFLNKRNNK